MGWQGAIDTAIGVGSIELTNQEGQRYRLDDVYYAPKASKQLLSEGKLFMNDGLIRMYRENSRQTGEFVLKKCDGFSLLGKIVNELYFVFEAKLSHQVYAIMCTMTTNQRDSEQIDEDVDIQLIRNQESKSLLSFALFSPSPTLKRVSTDETVDDAILWHNCLTHCAISTLLKAGIVLKSVQIDPHWCKSCVEGK